MTHRRRFASPVVLAVAAVLAVALPLLGGGCSRSPEKNVVATVGPRQITQAYYESKLARLKPQELPRDAGGNPVDTATLEGKQAFLNVIINKELMALKAEELGFGADQQITTAAQSIMEFNAPTVMHADLIEKPASTVTDAEVEAYYRSLQTQRRCSFIICNFEDDARKARQAVIDGGLWEDVADEYNDGSRGPNNDYTVTFQWGRLEDNFERAIWALQIGEISQPVQTVYGWWVLRLDAEEPVRAAPLESIKDRVLDSIRARKINLARREFVEESRRQHEFKMDENALWIIYQGLPADEVLLDPVTQKPTPREQLKPLEVPVADLDRFFYQVRLGDTLETWTIGDYKQMFDNSNVFERPKRTEMLGGLRNNIMGIVDRKLLLQEAKERGYMEDPRVTGDTDEKREQMMVQKLHEQVVKIDEAVSAEQLEEFWREHQAEYMVQETRGGKAVICASEEAARQARAAAEQGTDWLEILARYGSDQSNKQNRGDFRVANNAASPLRDPVFALTAVGQLAGPVQLPQGWLVARLDSIAEPRQPELSEVATEIGQRIRMRRSEQKLQDLLAEWRTQFPVEIRERALAKARPLEELAALPQPDNPLRRPQVR